MSRRIVVSIDTVVVDGMRLEPKVFEAALRRELGSRLTGGGAPRVEPRDSEGVGRAVAAEVHRELSR